MNDFEEFSTVFKQQEDREDEHDRPAVLVIDDDSSIRRGLRKLLEKEYKVLTAENGEEGLQLLSREIHCVILDVKMKNPDGFTLYPRLKQNNPGVPIIFYTAFQSEHDLQEVINEYCPFAYLEKGKNIFFLKKFIDKAVNQYSLILKNEEFKKRLERSEATGRSLLNAVTDSMTLIDSQGRILALNQAAVHRFGKKRDELMGMNLYELLPPRSAKQLKLGVDKVIDSRKPVSFEYRCVGHIFDKTLYPVLDRKRKVVGTAVYARDITRHRLAENQFRLLVETMSDGLVVTDKDGIITYANRKFGEMTGYSTDEIIGRQATDFLNTANKDILQQHAVIHGAKGPGSYETDVISKHGRKVTTIMSPKPNVDSEGNFLGSFAVLTDISRLKQTENTLRKSQEDLERKKNNFEELNTALRVLLKKKEEDKTKIEEKVFSNTKKLIEPYLEKLKKSRLNENQKAYVDILESNLNDIISPFAIRLDNKYVKLTPAEIHVANFVRQGVKSKQIAHILNISKRTVDGHRANIRKKLEITNKNSNLRSCLSIIHNTYFL
ncbi:MAG: PAS domain S-box protein [Desulfobacteraceae bacterium]|nr:MAG: PAS domain S-box protein [Desulfobacteraceae bacterium]